MLENYVPDFVLKCMGIFMVIVMGIVTVLLVVLMAASVLYLIRLLWSSFKNTKENHKDDQVEYIEDDYDRL